MIAGARERLGAHGQRTILFLDEIHRFNKAQQDALLPSVEEGLLTLIGATTENPYFEVNAALLSRCAVYELEPLSRGRPVDDRPPRRGASSEPTLDRRGRGADRGAGGRRRAHGAQHPRARGADRSGGWRSRSRRRTSRTPHASGRSATTGPATSTTTSPPPSSSRCAAPIPTPPSTTSPRCSRRARMRASSPAAW